MKKKTLGLVLAGVLTFALTACSGSQPAAEEATTETTQATEAADETANVQIANPWRDCTEEEASAVVANCFSAPEGATNVKWSIMENDPSEYALSPLVQLQFDYNGTTITAREQGTTGEEYTDISGMYYDWTVVDDATLANWADGNMPAKISAYAGDNEMAHKCEWFDIETGYSYCVSATAKDLDGLDIQAIAEQMYDYNKTDAAMIPDDFDPASINSAESSIAAIKNITDANVASIDITGCDSFTQIIDKKLEKGMGYANATLDGTDVLLVCPMAYDNMDGNMAAIDADIFMYNKDGAPVEVGKVCSGGTAYPLTIVDGKLLTGSNHWICKYALTDGKLMIMEDASVVYDSEGNGTYFYDSEDGGDYSKVESAEAEKILDKLFEEMGKGEVVNFTVVE